MSSILTPLSKTVNLPVVGTVSLVTVGAIGIAAYFLLFRRRRVTSVTTRYSRR